MPRTSTPPHRRLLLGLTILSACSAIAGGVELLWFPHGNGYVPIELLQPTPFATFTIPGLLLTVVIGGTSLVAAVASWRRSRAAIDATVIAGGALTMWIVAEVALFRDVHWLHGLYGGLGLSILALGLEGLRRRRLPRDRWIALVTIGEAVGFAVPITVGLLAHGSGVRGWAMVGTMAVAGLAEGLAFGTGQAWAFPFRVRRLRYAVLTSLAAGLVWALVLTTMRLGEIGVGPRVMSVAGLTTVILGLTAIGAAQWLELRHHVPGARQWIGWTALAWLLALPLSFTPSPLVDVTTPTATHATLFACAGVLMAWVVALVTWQGARRLENATATGE